MKATPGPRKSVEFEHVNYGTGEWKGDGTFFLLHEETGEHLCDEARREDAEFFAVASPENILKLLDYIEGKAKAVSQEVKE